MRALLVIGLLVAGCGGEEVETSSDTHASARRTTGGERPPPRDEANEPQIEGLMGTLSPDEVHQGLDPRMDHFTRCFMQRYNAVDMLGGDVELAFRVGTDGNVRWVYPRTSTVGDRATERCLTEAASRIRFPRPHGGEAEFSFPLGFDPPEDVRPPLNWDATRVEDAVSRQGHGVARDCAEGPGRPTFRVTAYVSPGGSVLAAGAAVDDADAAESLDCIAQAVSRWEMPDPGSYPAKVTFELR